MADYYLFLDELKANNIYSHFCLGGLIIEHLEYRDVLIPAVNALKQSIWQTESIILHETDLNARKKAPYSELKDEGKKNAFWSGLRQIVHDTNLKVLCVGIDDAKLKQYYSKKGESSEGGYYIAMQIILENYVHFLDMNNGRGSVYIESRDFDQDMLLQEQFTRICDTGTLFLDTDTFKKYLKTISFPMKCDNCIGIQIADFVPNPMARKFAGKEQRDYSLLSELEAKAYDGNNSMADRFGIKKVL